MVIEFRVIQLSRGCGVMSKKNAPQHHLDEEETTTASEDSRNLIWTDVRNMDRSRLDAAEAQLGSADECALVLIFTDQSSQLREQKVGYEITTLGSLRLILFSVHTLHTDQVN